MLYIYPLDGQGEHGQLARKFVESYHQYPPGMSHETIIVCNGAPVTDGARSLFASLPGLSFIEHDDSGWDIGGYQKAASQVVADLMVFFGGSTLLRREGWLRRMWEVFEKHGPGLYGIMGNTGDPRRKNPACLPHIRTTGFWMPPELLDQYPNAVTTYAERYEFEHGENSLTQWVKKQGMPAMMVTWSGEYDDNFLEIPNGLHKGDQSELIAWDRLNLPPFYPK